MKENYLTLVYEGEVNQSITKAFTSLAENRLSEENEEKSTIRKVYHVMVECLQNIYKHGDHNNINSPGKSSHGLFMIANDPEGYSVLTGNSIEKEKQAELKSLLDKINKMDKEELKMEYKRQIRDGVLSEKGGAGLGFIDICRKTGTKLEYQFESIDEKNTFFILKTYIAK